jgi:purine-binding chemotaxis protein CheW
MKMNESGTTMLMERANDLGIDQDEDAIAMKKYLIFVTDHMKLGVNADYVVEIITNHTITYLPMVPEFVRGIINLRGQIIPIVDIQVRMGKATQGDSLIIVLNVNGSQVGVLVDAVDQMIDIPDDDIHPMPNHSMQQMVSGMCTLPDGSGTMMVLDCDQLLHHE